MSVQIVIAGTGTDVGKTVFSAAFVRALDGCYWKPIQAGLNGETDSQCVARLSGLDAARILPEAYCLSTPASPHVAAEIDHIEIAQSKLMPPHTQRALIIEPAGGLAVPITRTLLQIDLLAQWTLPVVVCAKTELGTINHSLLSIEALKRRAIPILGIAFIGEENVDSQRTICEMGGVRHLGRLPHISPLTPDALHRAFALNFDIAEILGLEASGP